MFCRKILQTKRTKGLARDGPRVAMGHKQAVVAQQLVRKLNQRRVVLVRVGVAKHLVAAGKNRVNRMPFDGKYIIHTT